MEANVMQNEICYNWIMIHMFFFSRRAAEVPPVPAPGIEPGLPAWEGALGTTWAPPPCCSERLYFRYLV